MIFKKIDIPYCKTSYFLKLSQVVEKYIFIMKSSMQLRCKKVNTFNHKRIIKVYANVNASYIYLLTKLRISYIMKGKRRAL